MVVLYNAQAKTADALITPAIIEYRHKMAVMKTIKKALQLRRLFYGLTFIKNLEDLDQIKAICIHDFIPSGYEVSEKFFFCVIRCVNLNNSS